MIIQVFDLIVSMIRKFFPVLLICIFIIQTKAQVTAVTEDGRTVILFSNGTWRYLNDSAMLPGIQLTELKIPKNAKANIKGEDVMYSLWYDDTKWKVSTDSANKTADCTLEYFNGDILATVITDRIQLSMEKVKTLAINSLKMAGADFKISEEKQIKVNNTQGLLIKIDALIDETPFAYLNGYFSTNLGTVQIITYTGYNLFDRYRRDMTELISGFVISDETSRQK